MFFMIHRQCVSDYLLVLRPLINEAGQDEIKNSGICLDSLPQTS